MKKLGKIGCVIVLLVMFGLVGYIRGIVKLCKCDFKEPYKAEIVYGVGTVTGLGIVIGWLNVPDGNIPDTKAPTISDVVDVDQ